MIKDKTDKELLTITIEVSLKTLVSFFKKTMSHKVFNTKEDVRTAFMIELCLKGSEYMEDLLISDDDYEYYSVLFDALPEEDFREF